MIVIEICRETDKKAQYYINANKAQGFPIVLVKGIYYTAIFNETVYKSKDSEFKPIKSGLYIFS